MDSPTLIFDLDDTLLGATFPDGSVRPTSAVYDDAINRFVAFMQAKGFDGETARIHQHNIDMEMAHRLGFGDKSRFAESMVMVYNGMAKWTRAEDDQDAIRAIGMSVFTEYPYAPLEGALDVLNTLQRYYEIVIVTKGEYEEQHRKLDESGIGSFMDSAIVCSHKNEADWADVFRTLALSPESIEESWAIGNSAKADVNPLLPHGYNGLHVVDKNGWAFEHAELGSPLPGRVAHSISDISEVLNFVPHPSMVY